MSEGETKKFCVGILVVSDSCAAKVAIDQSGVNLREIIDKQENYSTSIYDIVSDDVNEIKAKLIDWSDRLSLDVILTTGGSGFAPRDNTPEATKQLIHKEATCLTHLILIESLKITKFAALSRATAGIRNNRTLIINLPGSKKGSQESLEIVLPVLKHALDLLRNSTEIIKKDHKMIQSDNKGVKSCGHGHTHHHHHESTKSRITDEDIVNRPRKSAYPMIGIDEAIGIILSETTKLPCEEVYYMDALNRICARDVVARDPLPPFAASVKDGFAVRLSQEQRDYLEQVHDGKDEGKKAVEWVFKVIGATSAGDNKTLVELGEGECVKINTGAPVPLNADAVVQIEDTRSLEKDSYTGLDSVIEVIATSSCGGVTSEKVDIRIGQDIRPVGFDIQTGEVVVREGMLMKSAQVGICATVGALRVHVHKQPVIGLISTGNELFQPSINNVDERPPNGKIRDSNKSLLHAALRELGLRHIIDAGIASDNCDSVLDVFREALHKCDVVVSTGGVSMGDKDLVKDVLEKDLNCKIHFARMNMKPGKPTTFATGEIEGKKKLLFCLPGNPVSAIVTFNLVVVPCLKKLVGYQNPFFTEIKVKCEFETELDPRPEYHRCLLKWPTDNTDFRPSAFSTGNQHSSRLLSMNEADCLVKLPPRTHERSHVQKGEILSALLINNI